MLGGLAKQHEVGGGHLEKALETPGRNASVSEHEAASSALQQAPDRPLCPDPSLTQEPALPMVGCGASSLVSWFFLCLVPSYQQFLAQERWVSFSHAGELPPCILSCLFSL